MIDYRKFDEKDGEALSRYESDLARRGGSLDLLKKVQEQNQKRKAMATKSEQLKAQQNKLSAQIPVLKKSGEDASGLLKELRELSENVKLLEAEASQADVDLENLASQLPNQLHSSTPSGTAESDNLEIKKFGKIRKFDFKVSDHIQIAEKNLWLDLERAGKVTGARFAFLLGPLAKLERALGQFFLDLHTEQHGYKEMIPPYLVNSASYYGTGQFPKFHEEVFHIEGTDHHLISTAEVPVTNFYRDEILEESQLPSAFCALSPCFRSEAGAAGRDTRGLIRQHQFHKVELMKFVHPSSSYEELEKLTANAEACLEQLELPYRRMALCSSDIGFSSAKTYDLEVWLPGAGQYREISSCSNFEDFQARRANIRFRPSGGGKPQWVHTLNGSGLAVGRTAIAVLENYQQADGSVQIPEVLRPYFRGREIL